MKILKIAMDINRVIIIKALFLVIIFSIFSYVYMINVITFDINQHQKTINDISIIKTEIGDLELKIVDKKRELSRQMAIDIGLTQEIENNTIFVLRGENTRLTFNKQ